MAPVYRASRAEQARVSLGHGSGPSLRVVGGITAEALEPFGQLLARRGAVVNQKPIPEALRLLRCEGPVVER